MKKYERGRLLLITGSFSFLWLLPGCAPQLRTNRISRDAGQQTELLLKNIPLAAKTNTDQLLPRTVTGGELKLVSSRDWTSGFFPGILWYQYELTRDDKWKQQAQLYTKLVEREQYNANDHDMGFRIYSSFGNGLRLAPDEEYKQVIVQAARTLCTRFKPLTGVIRSWNGVKGKWGYPVIIDNMMNLELLFVATQLSRDSSFYRIAVSHADITLQNHFRPDNSSYHVLDYDTVTGQVIKKVTAQGYADGSAWARGQAWGLYGFTMSYRFTKDPRYLLQAEKIAAFILSHPNLPADLVPYWDHNAPLIPNEERDVSAAAIMASALYELSIYSQNGNEYRKKADQILRSLTANYRSAPGNSKGFILLHSTGHKPAKSEIDVPIIYADYYYLEALLRNRRLSSGKSVAP